MESTRILVIWAPHHVAVFRNDPPDGTPIIHFIDALRKDASCLPCVESITLAYAGASPVGGAPAGLQGVTSPVAAAGVKAVQEQIVELATEDVERLTELAQLNNRMDDMIFFEFTIP